MIELSRGQELALEGVTKIRMGLGWDKLPHAGAAGSGQPDVDLDATAVQFAGEQLFDLAFYNNLATRDGSVVHLGDNQTGRGEGDDEAITVDLARVHGPVDTVFFVVSSYQGHSLEWIARAYCRIVDEERDTELARFTMTNGVPETGLVMAKLVRDGSGWKLVTVGRGIAMRVPSESTAKLRPFL